MKKTRSRTAAIFGTLLWIAVIGFEIFLLLNDITVFRSPKSELHENTGKRIAQVSTTMNSVRWQNPKDVVWNVASEGEVLFEGQSVLTLVDSHARLLFDGTTGGDSAREGKPTQTELEIGPQTLIELRRTPTSTNGDRPLLVLLSRGKIAVTSVSGIRKKIQLRVNSSGDAPLIEIEEGAQFEFEKKSGGGTEFLLNSGSAHFVPPGGSPTDRTREIKSGEVLRLTSAESEGKIKMERVATPAASPSFSAAASPSFSPVASPTASPRLSPSPSPFLSPPRTRALPAPKIQSPILRPRTKPSATPSSAARELDVFLHKIASYFLIPEAYADEAPSASSGEFEIELRWEKVPAAKSYRVQIAKTRNFKTLIVDESTPAPHWVWLFQPGMENSRGRVFYRVATIDTSGKVGAFSAPIPLTLPKRAAFESVPATPAIATPTIAAAAPAASPPIPRPYFYRVAPLLEFGSFHQSTDSTLLRSVSLSAPFFSQGVGFLRESLPGNFLALDLSVNHFKSESGSLPKTTALRAEIMALFSLSSGRSPFFVGGSGWLGGHFAKATAHTLDYRRSFSLGPSFGYSTSGLRLFLGVPLLGNYGLKLSATESFSLTSRRSSLIPRILVRVSGEKFFYRDPKGADTTRWMASLGPQWELE